METYYTAYCGCCDRPFYTGMNCSDRKACEDEVLDYALSPGLAPWWLDAETPNEIALKAFGITVKEYKEPLPEDHGALSPTAHLRCDPPESSDQYDDEVKAYIKTLSREAYDCCSREVADLCATGNIMAPEGEVRCTFAMDSRGKLLYPVQENIQHRSAKHWPSGLEFKVEHVACGNCGRMWEENELLSDTLKW